MAEVSGTALMASAVGFGRALRDEGLSGDLSSAMDFATALTMVDIGSRAQVRAAGAACFVRRRDELPTYVVRDAKEIERLTAFYPAGRLAVPDDIARAAVFLASDDSQYVTGSTLMLEGGFVCR